jgi:hypothetical protein
MLLALVPSGETHRTISLATVELLQVRVNVAVLDLLMSCGPVTAA